VYRLNTYPFLHIGLIHTLANLLALTPLLERFEHEHGTLVTVVMFTGRMSLLLFPQQGQLLTEYMIAFATFPAAIYLLISYIFNLHTPIQGASIWVFL
jgi:membrane associated rhomboid family serine protease